MKKIGLMYLVLIICLLLPATSAFAQKESSVSKKDIQDKLNSLANAVVNNDKSTMEDFYADDAISMPNHGKMLKGKDEMRRSDADFAKSGMKITSLEMNVTDILGKGDLIDAIGTYNIALTAKNGKNIKDSGSFLTVFENQKGKWKIKAEIWNTDKNPMMGDHNMKSDNDEVQESDTTRY